MTFPELTLSEERLVQLSKGGDIEAFEKLIAAYEKKAYNLAYRMLGNHEDTQDVTQDAFLKIYSSIGNFRGDCSFSTWVYRIVTNACLDHIRKRRHRLVSLDEPICTDDGPMDRQVTSELPGPEDVVWARELRRVIQNEITKLSPDYRSIVVLRDVQGLSYEEISHILNCSLGTVKSRLNRARKALRLQLISRELFTLLPSKRMKGGTADEL